MASALQSLSQQELAVDALGAYHKELAAEGGPKGSLLAEFFHN